MRKADGFPAVAELFPYFLDAMLAKLRPRDRIALALGAIAATLFLVMKFGVFPLLDRLPEGPKAIEEKELTLRLSQRLVAASGIEQTKLTTAQERLKSLEASLLESTSPSLANAEWQRLVRELADSKGIELGSSEFLRMQDLSPDYALVTGRVQLRCRLDQLVDFLVAVATSPKPLSIRRLRISTSQGDPEKRMNVELMIGAAMRAVKLTKGATADQR